MLPKKFLYKETVYMGGGIYIVKLENEGLKIQHDRFIHKSDAVAKPTLKEWEDFFNSVVNLNVKPEKPKHRILDGFQVKCHIIFKNKHIKFDIINPDFKNFKEFRTLVNSLTICDEYQNGLLEQED